ncbi:hypothetical protein HOO65_100001 [Ceratocystis lukuohia]|uniref:CCHC-type domain-containing protein n=1 Tax=Ceratocystis lukuohia TaxID=2019550 RepID=A0ABR4M8J7_9PEZI
MNSQAPDGAPQAPLLQPHSPQVAPTIDPQLLPATPLDDQPNDEAIEKHSTYLDKIARLRAGVEDKEYLNVDKESIATAINKLKGPAACYTTAQVQRLDAAHLSGESSLQIVYAKCNDTAAAAKARNALRDLCQGSKSLEAHLQRFEELLYLSGYSEFSDFYKIHLLKNSLSPKIMGVLYFHSCFLPEGYDEWVLRVQEIWQQMLSADRHLARHRARHNPSATSSRAVPSQKAPVASRKPPTISQGEGYIDWTRTYTVYNSKGQRRRAVWVSDEVLAQRRWDRVCLRCGASGHFIGSCPYAAALRPSGNRVPIARVMAQPSLLVDDAPEDVRA